MQFLARHRRAINTAFLVCLSITAIMFVSGCAAGSFLSDLESVIPIALTGITGVLSILATVDPSLAPAVAIATALATKIEADLTEVKKLQEEYKANASESTLADIESLISTTTGDLGTLLQTQGLPTAEANQIATIAAALNTELQALLSTLPVLQSSTAGKTLTVTKPSSASSFKAKIEAAMPPTV
jgi:hypothetical protein